jgi:hypothetical protein
MSCVDPPCGLVVLGCAVQLSALRQQIASLRAENLALRTALGGDKEAAGVIAAAGRSTVSTAMTCLHCILTSPEAACTGRRCCGGASSTGS